MKVAHSLLYMHEIFFSSALRYSLIVGRNVKNQAMISCEPLIDAKASSERQITRVQTNRKTQKLSDIVYYNCNPFFRCMGYTMNA